MKRMGTVKRMVSLAVGSLGLLALMVHVAGAQGLDLDSFARELPFTQDAAAPGADAPAFCVWGSYLDDGGSKAGNYTALVSLSNLDKAPHKYTVSVLTKNGGVGNTTVTLAGFETQSLDCTTTKTCGAHGLLVVQMDTSGPLIGNLFLMNSGGALTAVPMAGCGTVASQ